MRSFITAIAFLTRLPVGRRAVDAEQVARSERWFPLVGALLGGIYAAVCRLSMPLFPAMVTAVLLTALDARLTGAMHLDGLADTADGLGGGATREDALRIMRDHAVGSYGAAALALAIALKIAALTALIDAHRALPVLALAPVLGRWSAVLLSVTQPYARPLTDDDKHSSGAPARLAGRTELRIATGTALLIAAAIDPWRGPAGCLLVLAFSACWAWRCRRRIGGITGDTLGAAVIASECVVLLLFTAAK